MHLILAVIEMAKKKWLTEIFEGIDLLPHFNPDLDTAAPPEEVAVFRKKLREADGLLICAPEYTMGIPEF
jgi:NAD(P)H-dependent FMN reductase